MKILFYSYKDFESPYIGAANNSRYEIVSTPESLSLATVEKAKGFDIISVFTGDDVSAPVINALYKNGTRFIATRAAGYDNIDIERAKDLGIKVANVPEYSPYAIAEHALALMLALNRKLIPANKQVHEQNFTIANLVGFDLHKKTIGIIGTGKIGGTLAKILSGFGCNLIGHDIYEDAGLVYKYRLQYKTLDDLCRQSDIISIHTCLTPQTKHLVNSTLIRQMKKGVMLINTSRGGCVNTEDVINHLESGHIGYYGADVYEKERGIFFNNRSGEELNDNMLKKLLSMPDVLITPHQAFATKEALTNIAETTFHNIGCWVNNHPSPNELPVAFAKFDHA